MTVMKSSIPRSAAWLHCAEENPDEVLAAVDDKTQAVIRELEASTRRRAVRCALDGIVPEGHQRERSAH